MREFIFTCVDFFTMFPQMWEIMCLAIGNFINWKEWYNLVKYCDTTKTWKVISKKEFRRIVKKWEKIRETERLIKAIEENNE